MRTNRACCLLVSAWLLCYGASFCPACVVGYDPAPLVTASIRLSNNGGTSLARFSLGRDRGSVPSMQGGGGQWRPRTRD